MKALQTWYNLAITFVQLIYRMTTLKDKSAKRIIFLESNYAIKFYYCNSKFEDMIWKEYNE